MLMAMVLVIAMFMIIAMVTIMVMIMVMIGITVRLKAIHTYSILEISLGKYFFNCCLTVW